jgi:hypothetical protein
LARRKIGTAHNFANRPVFFACNGVQIRRRVSYKPARKKAAERRKIAERLARLKEHFTDGSTEGRRACLMIDGKRGGEWCTALHPERTTAARLRTVGGGYRGEERRQEQEWKAGRHDEAKKFGVA